MKTHVQLEKKINDFCPLDIKQKSLAYVIIDN